MYRGTNKYYFYIIYLPLDPDSEFGSTKSLNPDPDTQLYDKTLILIL
jgi:hypothetical protein